MSMSKRRTEEPRPISFLSGLEGRGGKKGNEKAAENSRQGIQHKKKSEIAAEQISTLWFSGNGGTNRGRKEGPRLIVARREGGRTGQKKKT